MRSRAIAFFALARAEFLLGGVVAVALGSSIAAFEQRRFDWSAYALVQSALLVTHTMTHYANEYFDRAGDALGGRTKYSGGSGVLQDGGVAPRVALVTAYILATVALALVTALFLSGHVLAGALAALALPLAWCYSAPPRLCARGLGELDTAFVVGIVSPLCAFAAQTARLDLLAFVAALPGALAMSAMMFAVETPDVASDATSGKRTLVVRLGVARAARVEPWLVLATVIALFAGPFSGVPPSVLAFEALALVPAGMLLLAFRKVARRLPAADFAEREGLAACGVAFYFLTEFCGALGFLVGSHRG